MRWPCTRNQLLDQLQQLLSAQQVVSVLIKLLEGVDETHATRDQRILKKVRGEGVEGRDAPNKCMNATNINSVSITLSPSTNSLVKFEFKPTTHLQLLKDVEPEV